MMVALDFSQVRTISLLAIPATGVLLLLTNDKKKVLDTVCHLAT